VLLIHGFTSSPPEMRMVADYLHQRGLTVEAPLLPGHGTTAEELNNCAWADWTGHAERALIDLQARCDTVFAGGLSMGALLALYLAAHHPELAGAIQYAPATVIANRFIYLTPVAKHFMRKRRKSRRSDLTDPEARSRIWSYEAHPVSGAHELLKLMRRVRRLLPQVRCPTLIIHSTLDTAIHRSSARYTYERVGSAEKELVTLHNSGHSVTVDSEWETVAEKTYAFIQEHR
jgi:carboxylesterase